MSTPKKEDVPEKLQPQNFIPEQSSSDFKLTPEEEQRLDNLLIWQQQSAKAVTKLRAGNEALKLEALLANDAAAKGEEGRKLGTALEEAVKENEALKRFKAFVHAYLTNPGGVPEGDPTNKHQIEGCRIGARLDLLFTERDALKAELAGTLAKWPDGTESRIPRIELDKWLDRLKDALDKYYGHETNSLNALMTIVQAIAALEYDKPTKEKA